MKISNTSSIVAYIDQSNTLQLYNLDTQISQLYTHTYKSPPTCVHCAPTYIIIGTRSGDLFLHDFITQTDYFICKFGFCVSCIAIQDTLLYAGDESGTIKGILISTLDSNRLDRVDSELDRVDSELDRVDSELDRVDSELDSSLYTTTHNNLYAFKHVVGYKQSSPILHLSTSPTTLYVLEHKGRLTLLPTKVSFDIFSNFMIFSKYLFITENNFLYCKTKEAFAVIFTDKSCILQVKFNKKGTLMFLQVGQNIKAYDFNKKVLIKEIEGCDRDSDGCSRCSNDTNNTNDNNTNDNYTNDNYTNDTRYTNDTNNTLINFIYDEERNRIVIFNRKIHFYEINNLEGEMTNIKFKESKMEIKKVFVEQREEKEEKRYVEKDMSKKDRNRYVEDECEEDSEENSYNFTVRNNSRITDISEKYKGDHLNLFEEEESEAVREEEQHEEEEQELYPQVYHQENKHTLGLPITKNGISLIFYNEVGYAIQISEEEGNNSIGNNTMDNSTINNPILITEVIYHNSKKPSRKFKEKIDKIDFTENIIIFSNENTLKVFGSSEDIRPFSKDGYNSGINTLTTNHIINGINTFTTNGITNPITNFTTNLNTNPIINPITSPITNFTTNPITNLITNFNTNHWHVTVEGVITEITVSNRFICIVSKLKGVNYCIDIYMCYGKKILRTVLPMVRGVSSYEYKLGVIYSTNVLQVLDIRTLESKNINLPFNIERCYFTEDNISSKYDSKDSINNKDKCNIVIFVWMNGFLYKIVNNLCIYLQKVEGIVLCVSNGYCIVYCRDKSIYPLEVEYIRINDDTLVGNEENIIEEFRRMSNNMGGGVGDSNSMGDINTNTSKYTTGNVDSLVELLGFMRNKDNIRYYRDILYRRGYKEEREESSEEVKHFREYNGDMHGGCISNSNSVTSNDSVPTADSTNHTVPSNHTTNDSVPCTHSFSNPVSIANISGKSQNVFESENLKKIKSKKYNPYSENRK